MATALFPGQGEQQIAQQLIQTGVWLGKTLTDAETQRQINNATGQLETEGTALLDTLYAEPDVSKWPAIIEKNKGGMRERVFQHVTYPEAKFNMENRFAREFGYVNERAHRLMRRKVIDNTNKDFKIRENDLLVDKPMGLEDLDDTLASVREFYQDNISQNDYITSPEVANAMEIGAAKTKIQQYILQQMDDKAANNPNAFIENMGYDSRYRFNETDKEALKAKYKTKQNINESARKERVDAARLDLTKRIPAISTIEDYENIKSEIYNNPDFDDEDIRVMNGWLDRHANRTPGKDFFKTTGSPKKLHELKLAARAKSLTEIQALDWVGKENGISSDDFFNEILPLIEGKAKSTKQTEAEGFLIDMIQYLPNEAVATISGPQMEVIEEVSLRTLTDEIKEREQAGKPMTAREQKEEVLNIYNNIKRKLESGYEYEVSAKGIMTEKEKAEKEVLERKEKQERLRELWGLEDYAKNSVLSEIWDELSVEGRQSALDWLYKGATPEQLIEHYKKKKR